MCDNYSVQYDHQRDKRYKLCDHRYMTEWHADQDSGSIFGTAVFHKLVIYCKLKFVKHDELS